MSFRITDFRIGFFSNAFKNFSLEYCADALGKSGYKGVELWCKGQHITPYDAADRIKYVASLLSSKKLEIIALSAHLDYITENEIIRKENIEKFKKVIELAKKFNVKKVVTASGYLHGKKPSKKMEKRFLDAMKEIGEKADEERIIVCLEAEPEKFLKTPAQVVKYIEELGEDRFKAVCDLAHAIALDKTPREFMGELGGLLHHVHLDDAKYNQKPHKHLIPGEGDVDYGDVFDYLKENRYREWISVELNRSTEYPREAAEKAMEFLRGL